MKPLTIIGVLFFLLAGCSQSTSSDQNNQETLSTTDAKVTVYYFYGQMRCTTCITLQEVAQEAVAENFANNEDVAFQEIDFSEKANAALAEKYEVVFSSLIIADENNYKDISGEAFALVMGEPQKLKELIVQETNAYLSE